jgi:hypothetical protein
MAAGTNGDYCTLLAAFRNATVMQPVALSRGGDLTGRVASVDPSGLSLIGLGCDW